MPGAKLAKSTASYDGPWVLVAPNNKAVDDMGSKRPYIYNDIEEMELEVKNAIKSGGCSTCLGVWRKQNTVTNPGASPATIVNRTAARQQLVKQAKDEVGADTPVTKVKPPLGHVAKNVGGRPPGAIAAVVQAAKKMAKPKKVVPDVVKPTATIRKELPVVLTPPERPVPPELPVQLVPPELPVQLVPPELAVPPVSLVQPVQPVPATDVAIPLVFCAIPGEQYGDGRIPMTWMKGELPKQRVSFELACGAGIGSPGLWLRIKWRGRDVYMAANIDSLVHQVVQTVVADLRPVGLAIHSKLYNDQGAAYFVKISGTPESIVAFSQGLWAHVRPNMPDAGPNWVDDGLGMRTTLVHDGLLSIRTHAADPADDRIGLPAAAIQYLWEWGLNV